MKKKSVTILLPVYNEEASFTLIQSCMEQVIRENPNYEWEFLFVNDGSSDGSLQRMEDLHRSDAHYCYVDLSRNYGKEVAMLAGFDYAKGDALIIMDADMQHPVEVIPEMLRYWEEGYDDVYARRRSSEETWFKRSCSKLYYAALQLTTRVPIQKNTGDFRLLDRKCVAAIRRVREIERNTKGIYSWIGFRKKGIWYEQKARVEGESKWSFMMLLNLAVNGITSYTIAPLRISMMLGMFVSLVAFLYALYIIAATLIWGESVAGFPTLMISILFLGGLQLFCMGIIGEYLGRVFNETKGRPCYFVQSYNGNHE